jgi:hypothetical protein
MNKNYIKFILSIVLVALLIQSCNISKHNKHKQVAPITDTLSSKCRLQFKTAKVLSKHVKENELDYNWINAKADVEVNVDGEDNKLDVKVRARKDSAIWISIQAVGLIDIAKLLITKD